jgi:hypothetical protein
MEVAGGDADPLGDARGRQFGVAERSLDLLERRLEYGRAGSRRWMCLGDAERQMRGTPILAREGPAGEGQVQEEGLAARGLRANDVYFA